MVNSKSSNDNNNKYIFGLVITPVPVDSAGPFQQIDILTGRYIISERSGMSEKCPTDTVGSLVC